MMPPPGSSPLVGLASLQEVISCYDVFLVDVWGVVHDGVTVYPGAVKALNQLVRNNKKVVFLSNNPRPGSLLKEKLKQLGIQDPFQVFTSGDATRLFLKNNLNKRVFHLGSMRNQDLRQGLAIQTVESVEDVDLIILSAFIEHDESVAQFDSLLQEIADRKIPVLCANPDKIVIHGDIIRYCAGTFAERLEKLGVTVVYYGKPSLDFYTLFYEAFLKKQQVPRTKILMIGDTMETDIEGARRFGIDSLLVLTENTRSALSQEKTRDLEKFLAPFPQKPTYYQESLRW